MEPLLPIPITLVVVVAFAVVTSTLVHRYLHGRAALSGVEYLFVGVLVGEFGVGLLSYDVIETLQPFLFLGLGLTGFSMGLRVKSRLLESRGIFAGVLSALLVAGLVGAAVYGFLSTEWAPMAERDDHLWLALTLGAVAAATSTIAIDMAIARASAHGPATATLHGFELAAGAVAIAIAGITLAESQALSESNQLGMTPAEWLAAVIALSVVLGVLFHIFIGRRVQTDDHGDRLFLALVGVITFTSGIAAAVGVSPLLTCAITGAVVSMLSSAADSLTTTLERVTGPSLAVLTIFAGAMWLPLSGVLWLLPLGYLVVRSLALALGTRVGLASQSGLPPCVGMGGAMSTQGGLAAAIALDFALVYPMTGSVIMATVLTSLVVFDFVGTGRLARFLSDAGEAGRQRFQPLRAAAAADAVVAAARDAAEHAQEHAEEHAQGHAEEAG